MGRIAHHRPNRQPLLWRCIDQAGKTTPPKGTRATIRFEVQKKKIKLSGSLVAKILRTVPEFKEEGKGVVWIGVQFEGPEEEIKSKLCPVFDTLFPGTRH